MSVVERIVVAQHERVLVWKSRSFERVLEPGVYWFLDPLGRIERQVYDITVPEFTHARIDVLLAEARSTLERYFRVVEITDRQIGLVYKHGRLTGLLPAGARQLYWRGPVQVEVSIVDVHADLEVPADVARVLTRAKGALSTAAAEAAVIAEVPDTAVGLLIVDGAFVRVLAPGLHAFWKAGARSVKVELVDQRVQAMEVAGQDILTRDKVSLRVNLTALWQVTDAVRARRELSNFVEYLYKQLQFALRETVGARTLDELLGAKSQLDPEIERLVRADIAGLGIDVKSVGIKDLILPGEMKEILNQVVQAEKLAQANLIKRREETAATRSLLNTARLMEDSPTLLRLKELETLEKVTEKIDKLTVFGGLDGILKDVVRIQPLAS